MQNRIYAVVILIVILGICCLGLYVAISGFLNNSTPLIANFRGTVPIFTPIPIVLPSDTPARLLTHTPAAINPTVPLPTLSIFASPSPLTSTAPSPTSRPNPTAAPPTATASVSCGAFQFCNTGGLPDPQLAPKSSGCPSDYIWGRVTDLSGKGVPEKRIRFRDPNKELGITVTKNTPDILGKYDIPSGTPSSQWVIWVLGDDGTPISPQVTLLTQNYSGAGNCPNRIDFKQQR